MFKDHREIRSSAKQSYEDNIRLQKIKYIHPKRDKIYH